MSKNKFVYILTMILIALFINSCNNTSIINSNSTNKESSLTATDNSSYNESSSSLIESSSSIENSSSSEDNSSSDTITYITIAEALKLCENNDLNTR